MPIHSRLRRLVQRRELAETHSAHFKRYRTGPVIAQCGILLGHFDGPYRPTQPIPVYFHGQAKISLLNLFFVIFVF